MFRVWAKDRNLQGCLGSSKYYVHQLENKTVKYIEFRYIPLSGHEAELPFHSEQILDAEDRIYWDTPPDFQMYPLYHGCYFECAASILFSGSLTPSDDNNVLGNRENHGTGTGCYTSPRIGDCLNHYMWPCNWPFSSHVSVGIVFFSKCL